MPPPITGFAAAILAGGRSSRMGGDKAFLPWDGRRLLDRQLELVRALGPAEILISGRAGVEYATPGVRVVVDAVPDQGPLGGLAAALEATESPHLLLLAVDLPSVTPAFLRDLLAQRRPGVGAVPRTDAGWEPLAAIYPREILSLVRQHLDRRILAAHRLIEAGVAAGLLATVPPRAAPASVFRNLNSPADLEP